MVDDKNSGDVAPTAPVASNGQEDDPHTLSPYTGGGGGTVLAHRVATSYLADLLLSSGRPETDELPVVRVAFQTNPVDPVDDLRVEAARDGERVVVHVAARRKPNFTKSHAQTAKLVGTLLDQVDAFEAGDRAYVAVALTEMSNPHREVQRLASLARDDASEAAFHAQVHEGGRHAGLANRYEHLTGLVEKARPKATKGELRELVWSLLTRLWILDFRVESDDETDWTEIGNRLNALARDGYTGADVRDRIHSARATQFDQKGAEVDRAVVRRNLHSVLAPEAGRSSSAWVQLNQEQNSALVAVQHTLAGTVVLPRGKLRDDLKGELAAAGISRGAVLVAGESGTGKSALTLSVSAALADSHDEFEFVVLNLRRTRETVAALSADLGMPLSDVLREMSAASRVLVLDAADAALEGRGDLLRELAAAAHEAELGLVLVVADTARDDVAGRLVGLYPPPTVFQIPGLTDDELKTVASSVPTIAGALRNVPTKSLYRRFLVIDLLARTGTTITTTLDDWGCLELIWKELINRTTPGKSSGEARSRALLSLSEEELNLPTSDRLFPTFDPSAIDTLRSDLLVAPPNLLKPSPEFAHDEVRRFATAVRLAQAPSVTEVLQVSGPQRWSMSAAKLACEGKLSAATDPDVELMSLVSQFDEFGDEHGVRWKDVPLEAAIEMPNAFDLLDSMLKADATRAKDILATLVKVVGLHHRYEDMVDVPRGEPAARLVVQEVEEPWRDKDEPFRLLLEWLNSALLERVPAGNQTREALRERLLQHWRTHHSAAPAKSSPGGASKKPGHSIFGGASTEHRRRGNLSYRLTQERYVQLFALLGPDINDDVRSCLREIASDSPSHLQPAVDLAWSALGVGLYDAQFLLELTEAYYIDHRGDRGWRHWNGIREHEAGGYLSRGLSYWGYGPFWVITRLCRTEDWVPVLNRMLNHAANIRCRSNDGSGSVDENLSFKLSFDGKERPYVGDTSVWGWYRGNTNGPYPCMSALQAIERWVDDVIAQDVAPQDATMALLAGCENLAMPALIVGCLVRHLEKSSTALDPYLREPLIWEFEFIRANTEAIGFARATDDGITNADRRQWNIRDVARLLVVRADSERRAELKEVGAQLISKAGSLDIRESTVLGWAATLDAANLRTSEAADGGYLISFEQPKEVAAELAPLRAEYARNNALLGLQNKYWGRPRHKPHDWTPPTPDELAADLAAAKDLFEDPPEVAASDPLLAVAYVAAASVKAAAAGHAEAFGEHATFAITTVLGVLGSYADSGENDTDSLEFDNDLGTRGAAASAVPDLLLPELAGHLAAAGATLDDAAAAAATLGPLASTEACLQFARGCDDAWAHPYSGDPCIHVMAYQWVLDLARACEIGEFDNEAQYSPRLFIEGDVMARVPDIQPDKLDTARLSATIRAVGRAACSSACVAPLALEDLAELLTAQSSAMVLQETSGDVFYIDDRGAQTMSAARALLHISQGPEASVEPLLQYLTTLTPDSHLLSAFLRDLASVGAETQELAAAATDVWPAVMKHVLDQVEQHMNIYDNHDTFNDFALSHLIPNVGGSTETLHHEFGHQTFDWVNAPDLVHLVPRWVPFAAGRHYCLLELIRLLRRLPLEQQLTPGLSWVADVCLSNPAKQLPAYAPMDEWLVEIKPEADARGAGADWLSLVDRLVYAGNKTLATFSR